MTTVRAVLLLHLGTTTTGSTLLQERRSRTLHSGGDQFAGESAPQDPVANLASQTQSGASAWGAGDFSLSVFHVVPPYCQFPIAQNSPQ